MTAVHEDALTRRQLDVLELVKEWGGTAKVSNQNSQVKRTIARATADALHRQGLLLIEDKTATLTHRGETCLEANQGHLSPRPEHSPAAARAHARARVDLETGVREITDMIAFLEQKPNENFVDIAKAKHALARLVQALEKEQPDDEAHS